MSVASRCPWRPKELAAAISRSTSFGVRYSLERISLFRFRAGGLTFPFSVFGDFFLAPLRATTLLERGMMTFPLRVVLGNILSLTTYRVNDPFVRYRSWSLATRLPQAG